jgi:hypothetical protein
MSLLFEDKFANNNNIGAANLFDYFRNIYTYSYFSLIKSHVRDLELISFLFLLEVKYS